MRTGAQTIPGLCDAVSTTAERLRHLAWHSAQQPPWSPGLTITSLRQAAETSTLTSHHCALLHGLLAEAAADGAFPAATRDLAAAGRAARRASGTWYQAARGLREVTTDTRGRVSPAATEARDLAWWTGRLAHADPAWALTSGPHSPPRTPHGLIPEPGDFPHVITAVHQAAEALALLADTEHHHLRGALRAQRILVPTRTLTSDYDIPRPYGPAPEEQTGPLLGRYQNAKKASRQATTGIGRAAQAAGAPSRVLATAREITTAARLATPVMGTGHPALPGGREQEPDLPGPMQQALRGLGVTDAALLARGAGLDRASQRLLIDAADQLPPASHRPPATTLNRTAATAALLNHALATGNPQAAQLLRPTETEREQPGPEPEPQA